MAYKEQEKCVNCGILIPKQPDDVPYARLCDQCYEREIKEWEK